MSAHCWRRLPPNNWWWGGGGGGGDGQLFDGTQGVCGGVLRGAGKQTVGAALNLFAFYCVGLPISLVLGFASPLSFFGIWYDYPPLAPAIAMADGAMGTMGSMGNGWWLRRVGLIIGVVVITACMLTFILRFLDWHKVPAAPFSSCC